MISDLSQGSSGSILLEKNTLLEKLAKLVTDSFGAGKGCVRSPNDLKLCNPESNQGLGGVILPAFRS